MWASAVPSGKNTVHLPYFSAVHLKTPQRGDPDDLQRDGQDRPGVCGPGRHQAVHRPPVGEGHLQHLPVLPWRAHEGQTHYRPQMDQLHFCEAMCPNGLYAGHTLFLIGFILLYFCPGVHVSIQCQIIYPRRQLFTMSELQTMGFVESEVSDHSLILRNIAL